MEIIWLYSRIPFPISAGESQKSREVQGLENSLENVSPIERRTDSIRLLATSDFVPATIT